MNELERLRFERDEACAERDALLAEHTTGVPASGRHLLLRTVLLGAQRREARAAADRDRYRSAWLSARRGRRLWFGLYTGKTLVRDATWVSRHYHDRIVRKYRVEVERLRGELYGTEPKAVPGCDRTTHCATWGFCQRCAPEFSSAVMRKFEMTDRTTASYERVVADMVGEVGKL